MYSIYITSCGQTINLCAVFNYAECQLVKTMQRIQTTKATANLPKFAKRRNSVLPKSPLSKCNSESQATVHNYKKSFIVIIQ